MCLLTCAISGISFQVPYMDAIVISHTEGYYHPIFAAPYNTLCKLYSMHTKGMLDPTDSYLLFLAFLHSSEKITWNVPVALTPTAASTKKLIQNYLAQLVGVLHKTHCISHPSFKQPAYTVTKDNCDLHTVKHWIDSWNENIEFFQAGRISQREYEALTKTENKLTKLILSGEDPKDYSHVIAKWASQAAEFPPNKDEYWKRTIRSCFNISKMFSTPLTDLKQIKDFCECNIEAGSIHFHTLIKVLNEGISRHIDYLGGSSLALGYTLLPNPTSIAAKEALKKNDEAILQLASKAPDSCPVESDFSSQLDFLKARIAYRTKQRILNDSESESEGVNK